MCLLCCISIMCKRVLVLLQTDTPEDMQGWIRDIEGKIQDFRGPGKVKVDLNSTYSSDQYY